jgi:hypothetical protein
MPVARFISGAFSAEVDVGSALKMDRFVKAHCTGTRFAALSERSQSRNRQ